MSIATIITDLFAAAAILFGFLLAFRQARLRRWLVRLFPTPPDHPQLPSGSQLNVRPDAERPSHYAMIIAGVMLMAFGVLIAIFATSYALMTE